jgi:hypothetical protein
LGVWVAFDMLFLHAICAGGALSTILYTLRPLCGNPPAAYSYAVQLLVIQKTGVCVSCAMLL